MEEENKSDRLVSDRQFLRLIARQFPDPADAEVRERILEIAERVADHTRAEAQESQNTKEIAN